jgi:DNA-binding transcriptional MerR regulator
VNRRYDWHADLMKRVPGLTYRKLDYWARTGIVTPTLEANGSGSRREYSEDDVRALILVERASRCGVDGATLAQLVAAVRDSPDARWARITPRGPRHNGGSWLGHVELFAALPDFDGVALVVPVVDEAAVLAGAALITTREERTL